MDFDQDRMATTGTGAYTQLDVAALPPLFVAYIPGGAGDSGERAVAGVALQLAHAHAGKAHSTVRVRFDDGDEAVRAAMRKFASFAEDGKVGGRWSQTARPRSLTAAATAQAALESGDVHKLCDLMDANFDLRRATYGDDVVGAACIELVDLARSLGFSAKFSGSGGAIICARRDGDLTPERMAGIAAKFAERGFRFLRAKPKTPSHLLE